MDGFEMKDNIILIAATNQQTPVPALLQGPSIARSSSCGSQGRGRSSRCPRQTARAEHRPRRLAGQTLISPAPIWRT
jgi:hypothetical protein